MWFSYTPISFYSINVSLSTGICSQPFEWYLNTMNQIYENNCKWLIFELN